MIAPMLVPTTRRGRSPRSSSARATPMWAQPLAPPPPRASVKPSEKRWLVIGSGGRVLRALADLAKLGVGEEARVVPVDPDRGERVSTDPAHLVHLRLPLVEGGLERDDPGQAPLAGAERAGARPAERQPGPFAEVAIVPADPHATCRLVQLHADRVDDVGHAQPSQRGCVPSHSAPNAAPVEVSCVGAAPSSRSHRKRSWSTPPPEADRPTVKTTRSPSRDQRIWLTTPWMVVVARSASDALVSRIPVVPSSAVSAIRRRPSSDHRTGYAPS